MAKFSVTIHYGTFITREVEAENKYEALDKACNVIDSIPDEEYRKEIVSNLYDVNDTAIVELKNN